MPSQLADRDCNSATVAFVRWSDSESVLSESTTTGPRDEGCAPQSKWARTYASVNQPDAKLDLDNGVLVEATHLVQQDHPVNLGRYLQEVYPQISIRLRAGSLTAHVGRQQLNSPHDRLELDSVMAAQIPAEGLDEVQHVAGVVDHGVAM